MTGTQTSPENQEGEFTQIDFVETNQGINTVPDNVQLADGGKLELYVREIQHSLRIGTWMGHKPDSRTGQPKLVTGYGHAWYGKQDYYTFDEPCPINTPVFIEISKRIEPAPKEKELGGIHRYIMSIHLREGPTWCNLNLFSFLGDDGLKEAERIKAEFEDAVRKYNGIFATDPDGDDWEQWVANPADRERAINASKVMGTVEELTEPEPEPSDFPKPNLLVA